ncbi:MAG TPA: glycosyltransferase [Candidatus Dormibacteraeota bacterium]|nr:glycosyltransferase [Candidatus Dormibacteraeota bacterium]
MKILWLSGYSPWPAHHGGKIRLYNLVQQMLARGHTVELWCVCNEEVQWSGPPPPGLKLRRFQAKSRDSLPEKLMSLLSPLPEPAWVVTTPELRAEIAALEKDPPDAVILEQALMGPLARSLPKSIPYVLDAQNVEWWLAQQIARGQLRVATRTRISVDSRKYRWLESELMHSAAAVMAMSDDDARRLAELSRPRLMAVRPSGVDIDYFSWVDHTAVKGNRLLMTGTLGYAPNLDACQWMSDEILPAIRRHEPAAMVDLVGGAAEEARGLHSPEQGVNVVGPVPDVRAYMERADVFVVPLRMGSGTRLKILEALAAGLPVVATSVAAEGLALPDDVILIGDTVDAIAGHVRALLVDVELRRSMSLAGRRHVEKHFSWADIAVGVEQTLRRVITPGSDGAVLLQPPLVSIGMPVHNAERYLSEALDSLLAQDYPNFEVIISDNASSDSTQQICEDYARRDCRVNYHRVPDNMGATWNFNRVFQLARGKYFMWAAYDDIRNPRCVSACVETLEAHPEAVLACTLIDFIDESGRHVPSPRRAYAIRPTGTTRLDRLRQVAQGEAPFDFYGLSRRDVLARVRRDVPTWGFDVIVLLELCLRGPVVLVPDTLFSYRRFEVKTQEDVALEMSVASPRGAIAVCWSCLTLELLRSIWITPVNWFEKLQLTNEFMLRFCVVNVPVAAGIRKDITANLGEAWHARQWGRWLVLLSIGMLVYPFHNRLGRSIYRLQRRLRGAT